MKKLYIKLLNRLNYRLNKKIGLVIFLFIFPLVLITLEKYIHPILVRYFELMMYLCILLTSIMLLRHRHYWNKFLLHKIQSTFKSINQSDTELANTKEKLQLHITTSNQKLESTNQKLESTNQKLESTNQKLKSTDQVLEKANKNLDSAVKEITKLNLTSNSLSKSQKLLASSLDRLDISKEHGHQLLLDFMYLDLYRTKRKKYLIEIGAMREGHPHQQSTLKLARFCSNYFMKFISVDMDKKNVERNQELLSEINTDFESVCEKGEKYLENYAGPKINYAYIDAYDIEHNNHSEKRQLIYNKHYGQNINNEMCWQVHLNITKALINHMTKRGTICIDDTWHENGNWSGKGKIAVPFLLENGYHVICKGYSAILLTKNGF